jgi:hypothetical protein
MSKCDSCDIDLGRDHLVVRGKTFCCAGCADGGPCGCSYERGDGRHHRNGHSDPVISEMLFLEGRDTLSSRPDTPPAN